MSRDNRQFISAELAGLILLVALCAAIGVAWWFLGTMQILLVGVIAVVVYKLGKAVP